MKKRGLLCCLSALPFLMGNAPAPFPFPIDGYQDFESSIVFDKKVNNLNYYCLKIKNTGDEYIDGCSFSNAVKNKYIDAEYGIYNNVAIAPGQEYIFYVSSSSTISDSDLNNELCSFQNVKSGIVTSFTSKSFEKRASSTYDENGANPVSQFSYDLSFSYEQIRNFDEASDVVIFKVEINGKERYYYNNYYLNRLEFTSNEDLEKTDIVVKDVLIGQGRRSSYYDRGDSGLKGLEGLIVFLVVLIWLIPGLVLAGLIVLIVFLIRRIVKKHKNKNKDKNNEINKENNEIVGENKIKRKSNKKTNKVSKK